MRNYSRKKSTPGKVAYRTPSRWKAGQPEKFKRVPQNWKVRLDVH